MMASRQMRMKMYRGSVANLVGDGIILSVCNIYLTFANFVKNIAAAMLYFVS